MVFSTKAVVALHNFLMIENNDNLQYCPPNLTDQEGPNGYIPGEWRRGNSSGLEDIRIIGSNNYSTDARVVRDAFKDYFNNEDSVDWQLDSQQKVNKYDINTIYTGCRRKNLQDNKRFQWNYL